LQLPSKLSYILALSEEGVMFWWKPILPFIPSIIDTATKLYDAIQKTSNKSSKKSHVIDLSTSVTDIAKRVSSLEENEIAQAKLVQNMAEQLSNVTTAINLLSKRIAIALTLAICAVFIAIFVLFFR